MATEPEFKEPETISLIGLANRFMEVHCNMQNRAFAFVLGAGASRTSGIKGAGEMVEDWVQCLHEEAVNEKKGGWQDWANAEALGISSFNLDDMAASYSELYRRMYQKDPDRGYSYLEEQMRNAEPSFGYSVLARIMDEYRHKVVVTTNFDNLVADSLSIFSTTYPLVCGHESLAGFISARVRRPLVVKVHRDLLLAPKSSPEDIADMPEGFMRALAELFQHYTPIVFGYGGNDGSLMKFFQSLEPGSIPGGVYWCYWEGGLAPAKDIRRFVAEQNGSLVPIPDFDQAMMLLGDRLEMPVPYAFLKERANTRADRIVQQAKQLKERLGQPFTSLNLGIIDLDSTDVDSKGENQPEHIAKSTTYDSRSSDSKVDGELNRAIRSTLQREDGERLWWQWEDLANSEPDPDKRERIYMDAISNLPDSAQLLGNYANFLTDVRKDHEAAEARYRRAIEISPHNSLCLGNYAVFLKEIRRDSVEVEPIFRRALEANPEDATNIGNYANFLVDVKKEYEAADVMYKRALEIDPEHSDNLSNYAVFLADVRQNHSIAEAMFNRALRLDPNNANILGNYARLLLSDLRVEEGLSKLDAAITELSPEHSTSLGVEIWMYATCHWLPDEWRGALGKLKKLLVGEQISTGHWDYSGVIESAIERGHPAAEWLEPLAEVCAGSSDASILAEWDAWNEAR